MIRGIIFDLDGTLLDTVQDIKNSLNFVLEKYGFKKLTDAEVKKRLGNGSNVLVKKALPQNIDQELLNEITEAYVQHYNKHNNILTAPYDGVLFVLEKLKENYSLAIASNKMQKGVTDLNENVFKGLIDVALGEQKGVALKPNPEMINIVLEKLNLKPEEVLYVGDTEVDMQTAKNANIKSVAVTWGFRTKEELLKLNPDYLINEATELLDIIQKIK